MSGKRRFHGRKKRENRPPTIQAEGDGVEGALRPHGAPVDRVLQSTGFDLDPSIRSSMEGRFGHDFSRVRVHTGEDAARSAQRFNAHAYTAGSHLVFGEGQYAPETGTGKRLLAHELTHVVQQSGAGETLPVGLPVRDARDALEGDAAEIAARVSAGERVGREAIGRVPDGPAIQRQARQGAAETQAPAAGTGNGLEERSQIVLWNTAVVSPIYDAWRYLHTPVTTLEFSLALDRLTHAHDIVGELSRVEGAAGRHEEVEHLHQVQMELSDAITKLSEIHHRRIENDGRPEPGDAAETARIRERIDVHAGTLEVALTAAARDMQDSETPGQAWSTRTATQQTPALPSTIDRAHVLLTSIRSEIYDGWRTLQAPDPQPRQATIHLLAASTAVGELVGVHAELHEERAQHRLSELASLLNDCLTKIGDLLGRSGTGLSGPDQDELKAVQDRLDVDRLPMSNLLGALGMQ